MRRLWKAIARAVAAIRRRGKPWPGRGESLRRPLHAGTDRGGGRSARPSCLRIRAAVTDPRDRPVTDRPSLTDLERGVPFAERHIGPRADELATMLAAIGAASLDELADTAVPAAIRDTEPVPSTLPPAGSETEVLAALRALAARNTVTVPMIGLGYHGTVTPPVIRRHVLENPAWYTAYTPYQPEISQGRLEALLTFQTTVADLTGLPVAGASPARRGHRRRRGDDAAAPRQPLHQPPVPRRRRHAAADPRRAAHPRRAARHRARAVRPRRRPARRASSTACCCPTPAPRAPCATSGRSSPPRTSGARSSRSPPTCSP